MNTARMLFCTRLLFVFFALLVMAAAPVRACEQMAPTGVSAPSHHSAVSSMANVQAAGESAPANAETSDCSGCTSCAVCACLCVGLARPLAGILAISSAMALPTWTAEPMASLVAAPELKPPRV
jgi:hypothetical protein